MDTSKPCRGIEEKYIIDTCLKLRKIKIVSSSAFPKRKPVRQLKVLVFEAEPRQCFKTRDTEFRIIELI